MSTGKIVQVMGAVVDCEFPVGSLPKLMNALRIDQAADKNFGTPETHLTLEVALHLGENRVRTVAMSSTDGLMRGMKVNDTGKPISMPVGKEVLGRIMNVIGEPVDELGPITTKDTLPIHRSAPMLEELDPSKVLFETGIKVIDLLAPYTKGGKTGLFGGAGVGKTVLIMELINNVAKYASIEAARAGEYGKGFAVVADEVRKLADGSARSAADISDMIESLRDESRRVHETILDSSRSITEGKKNIDVTAHAFQEILKTVLDTERKATSIADLSQMQLEGSGKMVKAVDEIAKVADDNAAATEQVSAATEEQLAAMQDMALATKELAFLAEQLMTVVERFQVPVEDLRKT